VTPLQRLQRISAILLLSSQGTLETAASRFMGILARAKNDPPPPPSTPGGYYQKLRRANGISCVQFDRFVRAVGAGDADEPVKRKDKRKKRADASTAPALAKDQSMVKVKVAVAVFVAVTES
jgi:hypothetical protein